MTFVTKLLSSVLLVIFSKALVASDAFVRTAHQEGQGVLRKVGDSCFLYTPKHVVTQAQDILVETRLRKRLRGELITTYPQDLAIVKLLDVGACEEEGWSDGGSRVDAILDVISSGNLKYRHQSGRVEVFDIEITNKAVDTNFDIRLTNNKKFRKGMSGSVVTVGDYPIGILLSVSGQTGTVLRMDTMNDLSRRVILRYATDSEKLAMGETAPEVFKQGSNETPPQNTTQRRASSTPESKNYSGQFTKGLVSEYKLLARGNTAYEIVGVPQEERARFRLELFDDADNRLFRSSNLSSDDDYEWGVGVTAPGEYTLKVIGFSDVGKYQFKVNTIATPEELVSESNVIGAGDAVIGGLADGTFAEYKIVARGNTAYEIASEPQRDEVRYRLEVLDDADNRLFRSRNLSSDDDYEWGVGVTAPGEYTLRVTGIGGAGRFGFRVNTIATPEELVSESNVIGAGDAVIGGLADGTFAEYKIVARGNTAYEIVSETQRDEVRYRLEVLDDADNRLFRSRNLSSGDDYEWGVGVTSPGEYTLRVTGIGGAGRFGFRVNTIATPEELVSQSNVLGAGDAVIGGLADGTFAEYTIVARGNTAYEIVSEPQRDEVRYRLEVLDDADNRLFRSRNLSSDDDYKFEIGPVQPGEYTLKVLGIGYAGKYGFRLQKSG